jgi:hypothetical protein
MNISALRVQQGELHEQVFCFMKDAVVPIIHLELGAFLVSITKHMMFHDRYWNPALLPKPKQVHSHFIEPNV